MNIVARNLNNKVKANTDYVTLAEDKTIVDKFYTQRYVGSTSKDY